MQIFYAVNQKLRAKWQLAVASFVVFTIASFAGIMIAHNVLVQTKYKSVLQANWMVGERVSHNGTQISDINPDESDVPLSLASKSKLSEEIQRSDDASGATSDLVDVRKIEEKKALYQKLAIDDARLVKLEEERERLPRAQPDTSQNFPLPRDPQSANDVREELSSALVHLLNLEKRENADNPEIIAVREQITTLQAQFVRAATDVKAGRRVRPLKRPSNDPRLDQINAKISLCGTQIIEDLQRLAQVQGSGQGVEPRNQTPEAPVITGSAEPARNRMSHLLTGLVVVISIAIGVAFSIWTVIFLDRRNRSIRNGAALQNLLPASAEYIGSVPRMKSL